MVLLVLSTQVLVLTVQASGSTRGASAYLESEKTGTSAAQSFLRTNGTRIVDAYDNTVLLRGVNYWGYHHSRNTATLPHSEEDYKLFAELGFNVVRLVVSWEAFEPKPGFFDESYLEYVDQEVKWAKNYGLYVVIDFHQSRWAQRFQGTGAPEWTVQQYPATDDGLREAVSNFWVNSTLQEHFIQTWVTVARFYANETAVAGYDILNEPWVYLLGCTCTGKGFVRMEDIQTLYSKAIDEIRRVDANHLIFLEMEGHNAPVLNVTNRQNLVWSPHFYPLAFGPPYGPSVYSHDELGILQSELSVDIATFVDGTGMPIWIGEFGVPVESKMEGGKDLWMQDAKDLFGIYEVGWAWWSYGYPRPNPSPDLIPESIYHPTLTLDTLHPIRRP
jgi:hypothetical protein